ncbi:hypothetical protein RGQ15_01960 [Paracoccus sp. MBLB3053]|uniref:Excinuclease ABC subunit A n=1 Tax=Paracoccus aurantius TaxID=3073814 RepID=A0ABU2HMS1_9RHOB|nr:hypothetical protein [Paracoccus sp. MBLB3053]MDS9466338.1 hypothetical protein [Paracoccus sp. MBLB3053]
MQLAQKLGAAALILAVAGMSPAAADPGRGHGKEQHGQRHDKGKSKARPHYAANCPPGLAKKNPPCVPPGQARKNTVHYGNRVGDILRVGDYYVIRDPRRYDLESRDGWRYYRDDNRVYRVDSGTKKVLAVLNLIDAFSN